MGGGLAATAAGSHRDRVQTLILFDPVDFSFLDDHISKVYLKRCVLSTSPIKETRLSGLQPGSLHSDIALE